MMSEYLKDLSLNLTSRDSSSARQSQNSKSDECESTSLEGLSSLDREAIAWKMMEVGGPDDNSKTKTNASKTPSRLSKTLSRCHRFVQRQKTVLLVSGLVFGVLCGAGVGLALAFRDNQHKEKYNDAMDIAMGTGRFFREELNKATMPLFSLATVAVEIQEFHELQTSIGPAGAPGSLPLKSPTHRNLTNSMCDDPAIVQRFDQAAARIKRNAKSMKGVLVLLELVPLAVVCLAYPKNNTEDFPPGVHLENNNFLGLDLLSDGFRWHSETTLKNGDSKVSIVGPLKLKSCQDCHPAVEQAFIARIPISIPGYYIDVPPSVPGGEPTRYPYWGFAVTKLNWKALVEKSGMYEDFERKGYAFTLTRTDSTFNATSGLYDKNTIELAKSPGFQRTVQQDDNGIVSGLAKGYSAVHTSLNATDNDWDMTVTYYSKCDWEPWVFSLIAVLSLAVAGMVFVILQQKHTHTEMVGHALAQEAMVKTERGMTSYFAHELRNPLGAIDSALKAMPDELPEDAKELLAGMRLCSSFMSGVMNNLLDVRQMDEGKVTLHRMPVNLLTVVKELHRMFLPSVHPNVQFVFKSKIGKREPKWCTGDLHRIQQVFTNVISNALKYTKKGSVTISIGWEDADTNNAELDPLSRTNSSWQKRIRFECADTGPGIPKHVQAQLFQRFARRGGAPGTGLGLAISKRLVDMMNGTIHFESDPTVEPGATCIVTLPLPPYMKPEEGDSPKKDTPSSAEVGAKKTKLSSEPIQEEVSILIVDDIRMNRMMLKRRILKAIAVKAKISEVSTGEEALELCKRDSFDVIIMDQYMEGAGGVLLGTDTIIALKRMNVASLLIGCSGNNIAKEFKDAGAEHCWMKPLPSNEIIIQQLRTWLDQENLKNPRRFGGLNSSTATADATDCRLVPSPETPTSNTENSAPPETPVALPLFATTRAMTETPLPLFATPRPTSTPPCTSAPLFSTPPRRTPSTAPPTTPQLLSPPSATDMHTVVWC